MTGDRHAQVVDGIEGDDMGQSQRHAHRGEAPQNPQQGDDREGYYVVRAREGAGDQVLEQAVDNPDRDEFAGHRNGGDQNRGQQLEACALDEPGGEAEARQIIGSVRLVVAGGSVRSWVQAYTCHFCWSLHEGRGR